MPKVSCFTALVCVWLATPAMAAGTFYVNRGNPTCSDSGPGSEATPYCSISAAVLARRGPGTNIYVRSGIYREQVTVPSSGDAANRLVIRALDPDVVVDGADDYSSRALWDHFRRKVWVARDVAVAPEQVFDNGQRLTPHPGPRDQVAEGTFFFEAGQGLYVNVGGPGNRGDNPGEHDLRVGQRASGFRLSGRSYVTVEGFQVTRSESHGIQVTNGSNYTEIVGNHVTFAGAQGITVALSSNVRVATNLVSDNANHGIGFTNAVTNSIIENNQSFRNARTQERAANGIYLFGSNGNLVQRNRVYQNQDTGFEITRDSHDNLSLQNISWSNGDHGFDHIHATGTVNIGNVAWGNLKDGFSVEGGSVGTRIHNCIAVDNGITNNEFDLYVDDSSNVGFVSDHNIFWNSTPQNPIKYRQIPYANVEDFANGTGTNQHSFQVDPLFIDPTVGDFHLRAGSLAIDSGDSSIPFWPASDADFNPRINDPLIENTGVGPVPYADRGAFEHIPDAPLAVDDARSGTGISLSAAYPNPSPRGVSFRLDLPRAARVEWSVHDLQGRKLWGETGGREAGPSRLRWNGETSNGERVGPGLYFARIAVDRQSFSRTLLVIR